MLSKEATTDVTDMGTCDGDKTENQHSQSVNLSSPKLVRCAKRSECSKLSGFGTAMGHILSISVEDIQSSITRQGEEDVSANDCGGQLNAAVVCDGRRNCDIGERRDGSGAMPQSSMTNKVGMSMDFASRGTNAYRSCPSGSTAGISEAEELNVGFRTASGKKLATSDEAVRVARARFMELDGGDASGELARLWKDGYDNGVGGKASDDVKYWPVMEDQRCGNVNAIVACSATTPVSTDQNMNNCMKVCPKQAVPSSEHLTVSIAHIRSAIGIRDSPVPGFQTAAGNDHSVSAKAIARAATLFDNVDDVEMNTEESRPGPSKKIPPNSPPCPTPSRKDGCAELCVSEINCPADAVSCIPQSGTRCSSDPTSVSRPLAAMGKPSTSSTSKVSRQWDGGGTRGMLPMDTSHVGDRSGFVTASGRPLIVSEGALRSARRLLESVGDTDIKGGSLLMAEPERNHDNAETSQLHASEIKPDAERATGLRILESRQAPNESNFCASTTASEKCVERSGAAQRKGKSMFESNADREAIESWNPILSNSKHSHVSEKSDDKVKETRVEMNDEGPAEVAESLQHEPQTFCSFRTASGRSLKISEESLKKASAVLEETMKPGIHAKCNVESPCRLTKADGKPEALETFPRKAKAVLADETVGKDTEEKRPVQHEENSPYGLTENDGKPEEISNTTLENVKTMHNSNIVLEPVTAMYSEKHTAYTIERPCKPTAADEKPVIVTKTAPREAKATLSHYTAVEAMEMDFVQPQLGRFCGVAAAEGNPISISEATPRKAKAIPDSDSTCETAGNLSGSEMQGPHGLAKAGGKSVSESFIAVKAAKALENTDAGESMNIEEPAGLQMERSIGFTTGNGRQVKISEAALKKAKALLDIDSLEAMEEDCEEPLVIHPCGLATTSWESVKVSEVALKKVNAVLDGCDVGEVPDGEKSPHPQVKASDGFTTASGKPVRVSEAALKKAKAMLDSDGEETLDVGESAEHQRKCVGGFSTASGKSVKISAAALTKAKAVFDSELGEKLPHMTDPSGFATASGKSVKVSEAALEKAKALLDSDAGELQPQSTHLCRLATASGKSVKVAETALKKVKAMFDSDAVETSEAEKAANYRIELPNGVAAARDETGKRSEDVFKKPRVILSSGVDETPVEPTEHPRGFATGSGKHVNICETALMKAKKMLASDNMKSTNVDYGKEPEIDHPCGFATANGKLVRVSETAMRKAKEVLSSCENVMAATVPDTGPPLPVTEAPCVCPVPAPDVPAAERGGSDSDLAPAGLTQLLDEKFEFTQVVAERRQPAEEDRSASPVLGTARRRRSGRRRTAEPALFRTPYRTGPARRAAAARSMEPPPAPAAPSSATAGPVAAPPTDAAPSEVQRERAEARRVQAGLAGAERRAVSSAGCLLRSRRGTAGGRGPRTALRAALGPRPANLTRDELLSLGVPAHVLNVTFASAASYRFTCRQTTIEVDGCVVVPTTDDSVGVAEVRSALLACPAVQPSLVPDGWVENAYRLVVWKLAAYERQFPDQMAGRCLNLEQLLHQLRYRYDRELDRCQRPALRRITEGDDTAAKTLILCIAEINTAAGGVRLTVSDGWYCVPAEGDAALQRLARLGKLRPGLKLAVHGAELTGQQNPCSPLEASAELCLRFSTNSCRRARWDARLGYHRSPAPPAARLASLLPDGGPVARLDAVVARVYPLLYYSRQAGAGVFRTGRCERRRSVAAEATRQARLERLYASVESQLASQERPGPAARGPVSRSAVRQLCTGQQVFECVSAAADPGSVESLLTDQQRQLAAEYQRTRREQHRQRLEAEMRARLQQEPETDRPATPLLKVRLAGGGNVPPAGAVLTLWRPTDELQAFLAEGRSVSLYGVTASGKRGGVLQLSAGCQLRVQPGPALSGVPARRVASAGLLACSPPPYGELDVAALVLAVSDGPAPAGTQTVQLADRTGQLLSAVCRPGLQALGLEGVVVSGAVLALSNLQLLSAAARPPLCAVTDRTEVSRRPTAAHLARELRLLTQQGCADVAAAARSALESALVTPGNQPPPTSSAPVCGGPGSGGRPPAVSAAGTDQRPAAHTGTGGDWGGDRPAQRRLQALMRYGPAPPISPLATPLPAQLRRPFRSPRQTAAVTSGVVPPADPAVTCAEVGPAAAAEIIRQAALGAPTAATDSPPIEPDSQLV